MKMGYRNFSLLLSYAVVILCVLVWSDYNIAFGQWPGEGSTPRIGADGWPIPDGEVPMDKDALEVAKDKDALEVAKNFICTFERRDPAQALSQLQMGPHGWPICPSDSSDYGSYFSADRREALEKLIHAAGVRSDRIIAIEKAGYQNAAAALCKDHRGRVKQLVIWDPEFLGELDQRAETKWASVAVLAHELGHHLNNDTGQNPSAIPKHERREQELYADRFAGQKLRGLGVSKDDAVAVFYQMGEGGDTHPHYSARVEAAGEGWESGRPSTVGDPPRKRGTQRRRRRTTPPPPPPPPPSMATVCQTPFVVCPMMLPLSRGSSCFCFTPYGQIPGVAQ